MTGLHNYQSSLQEHHQLYLGQLDNNHPVMDELLDQIFSLPSWSDVGGGLGKVPWDHHPGGLGANPGMDSSGDLQGTHKLFTMSLLPPGLLSDAFNDRGLGSQERESEDAMENGESNQYCNNDINFVSRLQQHELQESEQAPVGGLTFNDSTTLNLVSQTIGSSQGGSGVRRVNSLPPLHLMNGRGSLQLNSSSSMVSNGSPLPLLTSGSNLQNLAMLPRSSSVRSSRSEGSADAYHCLSPPPTAPVICQSYTGGSSPLPFSLGQNNPGNLLEAGETPSGDAHFLGKRSRSEEVPLKEHQPNQDNLPTTQGIVSPTYGTAAAQAQGPSPAVPVTGFNSARPRVRARRGQATDPHSIAERLRRERIAERMKSLQELVPNSNKTDKASMLEEIIDYVKFLQLQVKVLSMSRLGGACAVSQVINDLPSEGPSAVLAATLGRCNATSGPLADGLALTEHQVSRLMEEDMGTAMQYLQSKGLCLMPISLASAISSTGTKSKAINQGASGVTCDDKVRSHPQAVPIPVSGSLAVAGRAASFTIGSVGDESDSGTKLGSDEDKQLKGCIELNLGEMSNGFRDAKASRSPKSGVKSGAEEFHRQSQQ